MKRKSLLMVIFTICMFIFSFNVKALDNVKISCQTNAKAEEPFKCSITTNREVTIKYDGLTLYNGSSTMSTNGEVQFKADKAGSYDIRLIYLDENNKESVTSTTVKVDVATTQSTTKKTTSTTTTTKKKSSNNYLKTITIDGEELVDFSKEKNRYEYDVDNKITKLNIEATAEEDSSIVKVDGPKSLTVGENIFTISVTSEDNTTKYYKVIVTRAEEISNNTKIEKINIKGYSLKIDGSSKTYYLDIKKDTNKLDIEVITSDDKASYDIEGNEDLINGSIIKIKVTAQNNDSDTYRIIINKPEEKKSSPILLIIIIIILILVIGITIFIVIKKKNDKNKKNSSNKPNEKNDHEVNDESDKKDGEYNNMDDNEIDSDEIEKTKILSFENFDDEKTKIANFDDFDDFDF